MAFLRLPLKEWVLGAGGGFAKALAVDFLSLFALAFGLSGTLSLRGACKAAWAAWAACCCQSLANSGRTRWSPLKCASTASTCACRIRRIRRNALWTRRTAAMYLFTKSAKDGSSRDPVWMFKNQCILTKIHAALHHCRIAHLIAKLFNLQLQSFHLQ